MKKTWTQEQIIALLREAESGQYRSAELCRLKSVSQNSFYKWRTQYGSMQLVGRRTLPVSLKANTI